jgi:hypothetical protein
MPSDLTVVCVPCKVRYEQSINNLLKINKDLEAELAELKANPTEPDRRDELIGMIAPYIVNMASIRGREQRIYDICDLYFELYPEGAK